MKSILQVVVEEEYERARNYLALLLTKLNTDDKMYDSRLISMKRTIESILFARHCLGIEEVDKVLDEAIKVVHFQK